MYLNPHIAQELATQRIAQLRSEASPRPESRPRRRRLRRTLRALRAFPRRQPAPDHAA